MLQWAAFCKSLNVKNVFAFSPLFWLQSWGIVTHICQVEKKNNYWITQKSWEICPLQAFYIHVRTVTSCLLETKFYMWHPNKWFQIIFSCPFSIIINYDFLTVWFCFLFCFFLFFPSTETSEEPLVDLSDVLNTDADILGMLGKPSSDSGASHISQAVTMARIC